MLESRPEDALVKLVTHVKLVKLVIKLLFLDFLGFFFLVDLLEFSVIFWISYYPQANALSNPITASLRGSHGLSGRGVQRAKSSKPEDARRSPRLLVSPLLPQNQSTLL